MHKTLKCALKSDLDFSVIKQLTTGMFIHVVGTILLEVTDLALFYQSVVSILTAE